MTTKFFKLFSISAILLTFSISIFAQTNATISGKITFTADQKPLHNATVQIVQLKKTVQTDEDGSYKLENIPAGRYTILAHFDGFSDVAKTIVLMSGATSSIDFTLSLVAVKEQVTVTASGAEQSTFDSFQSVNSVSSNTISQRASTSIGEVLEGESGVAKRSFGTGSARPVIRGFDGDRVLVAQDGVRSGSLGSQSGDHGEPIDTLGVERIEVVKGPATLLYGSNAIGGVVNAISNHEDSAHDGFRGYATVLGGTANRQFGSSGGLEYGYKKFMVWGNSSFQNTNDFNTPLGKVPNTASRATSSSIGAGYFVDKGFLTGQYNFDKRRYGIPFAGLFEGEPDAEIDLDMRSHNYRLNGGFRDFDSFITGGKFTFNYNKYQHKELEVIDGIDNVGTVFDNRTISYRTLLEQKPFQKLTGRFGVEGYNREYQTVGAEQLIDGKVKQNMFSVFGLEEFRFGRVSFQLGGRVENNRYRPENTLLQNRSFTGFSGAVGMRVGLWENGAFVVNYTSSYRAPALEELYNFGPHIGNVTFEVGDQNLKRERANGFDMSLRHQSNRIRFETNFFYYRINDFVFLAYTDEDNDGIVDIEDGLPVANYTQGNSQYFGAEFNFDTTFNQYAGFFVNADFVRAKLVNSDINLPRIPPAKMKFGFDFNFKGLNVRPEGVFVSSQERLFPLETRTGGYGLFNVSAAYVIGRQHNAHIIGINAFNLFDKEYRNHLSFIKDLAPEIGRGVRLSYTFRFF